jgi:glycerophosphoryl diester phosphodiesterase
VIRKNLIGGLILSLAALACSKRGEPGTSATTATAVAALQVKRGLLVARGMGDIDGVRMTNSLEALRCNHKRGFRWFDVDLATTADGELMCFHKGNEKLAGLSQRISDLTVAEVEGKKYANRYPITRLSKLLEEADRLGDVVLVLDTEGWSERVEQALSRTLGYGPKHVTRIVLQFYGDKELKRVTALSRELDAGVLLKIPGTKGNDAKVEELVKKSSALAVVASSERFTPWLAERLHAINTPVLVYTIDDHHEIVRLTRAGADGFYTDGYLPFGALAADPTLAFNCGETKPSAQALAPWTRRDLHRQADVRLPGCANRKGKRVELKDCEANAMVRSNGLAVPPRTTVHVQVDAEAGDTAASFWIEALARPRDGRPFSALRPREEVSLKPKERRTVKLDFDLADGSSGVEAQLGLASKKDQLTLHRLRVFHGEALSEVEPTTNQIERDGGD